MRYLEAMGVVHRDICALNILVCSKTGCKISGFSKSRFGTLVKQHKKDHFDLRIRWSAPESIIWDVFSNKTDVWSFGVLIWEILSYGQIPYGDVIDEEILKYLSEGNRLKPPQICPHTLQDVMLKCFEIKSDIRPSFFDLFPLLIAEEEKSKISTGLRIHF
ncbi:hypothetical protein HZS_2954 [Henneguya salminicola]|nr:hypothetical protein HZS_2954 [Henneguya salminicola]